jgi:NTP pyrophosphatase (non-canonical NTP hydrolase)
MSDASGVLSEQSNLRDIQDHVWRMNKERGFSLESPEKRMLLLTEEVGEVAKAVRKLVGMKFDTATSHANLAEEIADVLIVLSGLASMTDIDLYEALVDKEAKNKQRRWK